MKKIKNTLAALVASAALASGAMANDRPNTNYFSVGSTVTLVENTASIQGLDVKDRKFGINITRRIPLADKKGLQAYVSVHPEGFSGSGLDFCFDNMTENLELYAGGGLSVFGGEAYFSPHMGAKYHFWEGTGPYLSAEFGVLVNPDKGGLYGTLSLGVRFDLSGEEK